MYYIFDCIDVKFTKFYNCADIMIWRHSCFSKMCAKIVKSKKGWCLQFTLEYSAKIIIIIQLFITNTLSLPETFYWPPDFCNPSSISLAIFWLSCFHLGEMSSFLENELKNKHWYCPWLLDSQGLNNTVTGKNFNKCMLSDYTVST